VQKQRKHAVTRRTQTAHISSCSQLTIKTKQLIAPTYNTLPSSLLQNHQQVLFVLASLEEAPHKARRTEQQPEQHRSTPFQCYVQ
jgi:hypothetical protein